MIGRSVSVTVPVTLSAAGIRRFAAGIGLDAFPARRPTTYPIAWLTHAEVIATVRSLATDRPTSLPVHELQTVETRREPPLDTPLRMNVTATRKDADRITLEAELPDAEGDVLVRLHTIFRLVP